MASTKEQMAKIAGVVAALDEHLGKRPKAERRRQERVAIRLALTIALLGHAGAVPTDVYMRNISLSGMGFVSRRLFRQGERVVVSLAVPGVAAKLVLARIAFGRYVSKGLYEMGAEFLQCVAGADGGALPGRIPAQWLGSAGQALIAEVPAEKEGEGSAPDGAEPSAGARG